jgi:hypothetical protein
MFLEAIVDVKQFGVTVIAVADSKVMMTSFDNRRWPNH